MSNRRKATSLLGAVSLITGVAAIILWRQPMFDVPPVYVGAAGAGIGLLGLLSVMLRGNTGPVLPVLGIIASLVAPTAMLYDQGRLDPYLPAKVAKSPSPSPAATPKLPNSKSPTIGTGTGNGSDPSESSDSGSGSIFDDKAGGPGRSGGGAVSPVAPKIDVQPGVTSGNGGQSTPEMSAKIAARKAVVDAQDKLNAARENARAGIIKRPDVAAAQKEADTLEAEVIALRYAGPGPKLTSASQRWIESKGKLAKLIEGGMSADPNVQLAARQLREAELQLK